jgi:D-alanine-D-alanine ligase
MAKIRLGVIFGGRSGEHEISLRSARSVIRELDTARYEIIPILITKSGQWFTGSDALERLVDGDLNGLEPVCLLPRPGDSNLYRIMEGEKLEPLYELDAIFPVLHGTFGEDGTLQGLLEMAEIPYVGAGVLASSVAMDKGLFKDVMEAREIPIVDFTIVNSVEFADRMQQVLDKVEGIGPYPLFVKPANMGSSVGISKCRNRSDLLEGLMEGARYDRRVIVERGVDAREIEVSVLGNEDPEASITGEIIPGDEFYSYNAKYIDDDSELIIPAPIEDGIAEKIREIAIEAFIAIDGAGMGRVDFLLERNTEEIYLNEINTIPGFTSISMYPKLWEASGLPYGKLLDRLVDLAFERQSQRDSLERSFEVGS